MTDGQRLYAVFAALYLLECLYWLPLGVRYFLSWKGWGSWLCRRPSVNVGFGGSGAVIAWPLPPLGGFFLAESWPVIPSEKGLWIGEGQLAAGRWIAWDDLKLAREQRTVTLMPGVSVKCATERRAASLMQFLAESKSARGGKRKALVERWWQETLEVKDAQRDMKRYAAAGRSLRWLSTFVWLVCFAWVPFLYWWFGAESWRLLLGVGVLLVSMAMVAFTWRKLDKRLFPDVKGGRWVQTLHLMLMPTHTIRALDLISVELMARSHPLCVGKVTLTENDWLDLAGQVWRRWNFTGPEDEMREAAEVVLPRLKAFFEAEGVQLAALEPAPAGDGSKSYCPRCLATYVTESALCNSCGDVPTRAFEVARTTD